jgi:methylamine---glutamate N-methyltransferase subunit C
VFIEDTGIPTMPAVRLAAAALRELKVERQVGLIVSGGIRSGADVAKALALGADAVSIVVAALLGLGCNRATYPVRDSDPTGRYGLVDVTADYEALGAEPGLCSDCHTGRCPVGITTQDADLVRRLDPEIAAQQVANYLRVLTIELTAIARACGRSDVHHLEPEDPVALTVESAAMARVSLAGTDWISRATGR